NDLEARVALREQRGDRLLDVVGFVVAGHQDRHQWRVGECRWLVASRLAALAAQVVVHAPGQPQERHQYRVPEGKGEQLVDAHGHSSGYGKRRAEMASRASSSAGWSATKSSG